MIKAKMIVDFDNPLSMKYMELSLESFEPLSDLLEIIPVQCTKPETLPIRFDQHTDLPTYLLEGETTHPRFFGGDFEDHPIYQSIMYSHFKLWREQVDSGERFIIMEHDAALINEKGLRYHLENWQQYDIFMPGACMEFYSISDRWIRKMDHFLMNYPKGKRLSGPYGVMWDLSHHLHKGHDDDFVLIPTKLDADNDWLSDGRKVGDECAMTIAATSRGQIFKPCVKQYFMMARMNTSPHKYNLDTYSCATLPGSYSWRRDFVLIDDLTFEDLDLPEEFE